jgi:hypothetical protein
MRYYLIGGDGREYGPVDAPTLTTWIAANRADACFHRRGIRTVHETISAVPPSRGWGNNTQQQK